MHPILIQLGPITLHSYGVLVATGILLALWLARRQAPRLGLDPDDVWNLGIYMVLAGLVGAKLWYVLENGNYYMQNPRALFSWDTLQAAGVWYGGLLSALVVAALYVRKARFGFLPLVDTLAAPLALGHGLGRLGCFSAGCCWGKPTTVGWGVTFTSEYAAQTVGVPLGTALHPTQLYEFTTEMIVFGILLWLGSRRKFPGQLFAFYLMWYGVARGTIEFFRGDPGRTQLFGTEYSLMQVVSIGLILLGAVLWHLGSRRPLASAGVAAPAAVPARSKRA
jgi:phosphatidylglycerol:prolipoprotein diacylglycerol transferase